MRFENSGVGVAGSSSTGERPEPEAPRESATRCPANKRAPCKVLLIEDDAGCRELIGCSLPRDDFDVVSASSLAAGRRRIAQSNFELVLLDVYLEDGSGVELLPEILQRSPRPVVVVMSGRGSIDLAVAAIKAGAADFLSKPFSLEELRNCVSAALAGRPARSVGDRSLIGESPAMLDVAKLVRTFAPMDLSVLLLGETGTGKEVLARSLHNASSVSAGPFVDVDCSALPATLLEAELFGTEKGAFTDARERRLGKFELADGGTLFLDEIGNLTYDGQARLLRVLQERSFRRVGGTKLIEVDVRVIAATNLDLEEEVRRGAFRQDLYFRLAEMTLELPPLRERTGDVLLLAVHFLEQFNGKYGRACPGFSAEAVAALEAYSWPGNVRELQSTVRTALLLCTASIEVAHLPGRLRPAGSHPAPLGELPAIPAVPGSLFTYPLVWPERGGQMDLKQIWRHAKQQLEREIIFGLLRRFGYTKADLARCLDLDYKVLLAKLRELEIELKPHG